MKSKNLFWAIIFLIIIILCVTWYAFFSQTSDQKHAEIYIDGELIKTVENLFPDEVETMMVRSDNGYNKVCWDDGDIWVDEADCDNHTCIQFGKLSSKGLAIICAPHGLEIRIVDNKSKADIIQ